MSFLVQNTTDHVIALENQKSRFVDHNMFSTELLFKNGKKSSTIYAVGYFINGAAQPCSCYVVTEEGTTVLAKGATASITVYVEVPDDLKEFDCVRVEIYDVSGKEKCLIGDIMG